jgi:hypothetical protein
MIGSPSILLNLSKKPRHAGSDESEFWALAATAAASGVSGRRPESRCKLQKTKAGLDSADRPRAVAIQHHAQDSPTGPVVQKSLVKPSMSIGSKSEIKPFAAHRCI